MQKLDMAMYAATQDNPGGPVYMMVEDDTAQIAPYTDETGQTPRGGIIGYAVAYGLLIALIAYFMLAV
ncbi:hypothetical protein [Sphingobium sp. RAC03]|jgi:hypothetical protein|uniref:hypothetical protein n=1 Tax=Sphingobium sp. RAC03 TaxID=1843368 RepID=UPI00083CB2F4|nr:hypothetical protein [Sphingobium sp. RAC03]AOF98570.1 hypothetical protein BSY17_4039 [Sphingobium sp. RAC03]